MSGDNSSSRIFATGVPAPNSTAAASEATMPRSRLITGSSISWVGLSLPSCRQPAEEADQPRDDDDRNDADLEADERERRSDADQRRDDVEACRKARRQQHVPGEEHRQVGDDTDHGGGDAGERRRQPQVAVRRLDERPPQQDEEERRQEGEEGDDRGSRGAREEQGVAAEDGPGPAADETDERDHHDQ